MIYKFESIDSTNNYLKTNYKKFNNFDICVSSFQTNGRGRNTHLWESNKGENLLFSILIKDKSIINKINNITLLIGVSVFKYLKELSIKNISIKWPNDIYVNYNKICGILCESICVGDCIDAIIIGIGLNVNQVDFHNLKASSIYNELKIKMDLDNCLSSLVKIIKEDLINNYNYLEIVNRNNYLFHKKCFVYFHNKKVIAEVLDINDDNSINCIIDGNKQKISVNEITLIK